MESLNDSSWDVIIIGTGLYQSFLALSLSRSDKKILTLDKNDYYGGSEAALTLQDFEEWTKTYTDEKNGEFGNATLDAPSSENDQGVKLASSRSYSLALAPHLIYTDAELLKKLVSSKVYRQLDFLAMGAWWIYTKEKLVKVPTSREDVAFAGSDIDIRSKRLVMKVLRFMLDYEEQTEVWEPYRSRPLQDFLKEHFKLTPLLVDLFLGLTFSLRASEQVSTEYSLPRVARHLRSIGRLGPGFSSVIPKWGGLSELSQICCRAGAVGGAVYMLKAEIKDIQGPDQAGKKSITLHNGDVVHSPIIIGAETKGEENSERISRSITIVSTGLKELFPPLAEGSPPPAGSVVVFPAGSLAKESTAVYLIVHTSDTGECPKDQSIIYATTKFDNSDSDKALLKTAVDRLLTCIQNDDAIKILWSLFYTQKVAEFGDDPQTVGDTFPLPPLDLVFSDQILDTVRQVWLRLRESAEGDEFLTFEDRAGEVYGDDDDVS